MTSRLISLIVLCIAASASFGQVPTQWNSRGVGGGGALFAPSINPANDDEYYASGAPGYVPIPVKTIDGGSTWLPLSGNPDNSEEILSINVDYNNPKRVLISYYGAIYFSSNGGATFTNSQNAAARIMLVLAFTSWSWSPADSGR